MSTSSDRLPDVMFRVPGPWRTKEELRQRLPSDCRFVREGSVMLANGRPYGMELMPADREFPSIFQIASRRRPLNEADQRRLDAYQGIVGVIGIGGSLAAARELVRTLAGFVSAGGIGVFIDNCLLAHSGSDWQELADNSSDPDAVTYAFMNIVHLNGQLFSRGMAVFGAPDGIINDDHHLDSLEDFLRSSCKKGIEHHEGDEFTNRDGVRFRLQSEEDQWFRQGHAAANPYGMWRLCPVRERQAPPVSSSIAR